MLVLLFVLALSGAALGLGKDGGQLHDNLGECQQQCRGERVIAENQCRELPIEAPARFYCQCEPGYYDIAASADAECGDIYWSLFTYGTFTHDEESEQSCKITCAYRIRVWTTVFIFVVFAAAVIILIFILPMCIASCQACLTAKKERKTRKKQQAAEAGAYAGSYDGAATVGKGSAAPVPYNPYMYWPQSYYQTR